MLTLASFLTRIPVRRRKALLFLSLPPTTPQAFPSRDSSGGASFEADLRLAALETLVNSVRAEPYNWSAWLKIAECLDGPEEVGFSGPFYFPPSSTLSVCPLCSAF